MDLDLFRRLRTPEGRRVLERAAEVYDEKDPIKPAATLRRDHPAELVAAALTQVGLRRRAEEKFGGDSARMFFTRDGLEQATTRAVADHRARRPAGRSGLTDLCCGIGGDLIAFARAGLEATGVDRDPLTVEIARANLAALDVEATVVEADVEAYRPAPGPVFADPARRGERGRTFDPSAYSPPWDFVLALLRRGPAGVKTTPAIPHSRIPEGVETEWVSLGGEVKEATLWSGDLRTDARMRATILPSGSTLTDRDDPGEAPVAVPSPGQYVYEPDGAVIRAGLVTAVAPLIDGSMIHPKIAYLTSDRLEATPFARAYAVREVLPYDLKILKRRLQRTGTLTIKKRGLDVDPEKLRKRLLGKGPERATLIVTRTPERSICLIVEPVHAQ